jgi:4-amino-4-deoxy-L-arabinose transferase-like glycosyltransferase
LQIHLSANRSRLGLAVLCVIACLLCVSTYRVFGNFWDEPEHIAAGVALIDRDLYLYDNQHPPFARLLAAIGPYLAGVRFHGEPMPVGDDEGRDLLYNSPASYDTLLRLARLGMLPFLVTLLCATWHWARRWLGDGAALPATLFLTATPVILGHAAVVAVDVPVTALIVLSLYLLLRWVETPTWMRATGLGLAAGLATATKLSAIPFLGVALIALVLSSGTVWLRARAMAARPAAAASAAASPPPPIPPALPLRRLGQAVWGLVLSIGLAVAVYGPRLVHLTDAAHSPSRALDFWVGTHGPLHDLAYRLAARVPLPYGFQMLPLAILGVEWHNTHGHMSFLLGQTAPNGWWYFYPVALAVKTPLPLLLLGLAGLTMLAVRGVRSANLFLLAPPACFVSIMLFACLYSHINIGVRHVLIAFPLLALGAGYLLSSLWPRACAVRRAGLCVLVLCELGSLIVSYPDYVAYFNLLAGRHPERILVDSDLDWGGQDLRRLERVLAQRHVEHLTLGYKGTADLSREALPPFDLLKPGQPVTGWVAITMLTLQENKNGFAWLDTFEPVQRVGKSFALYFIPPR